MLYKENNIRRIFISEKLPYIFTLLIAIIAFHINFMMGIITKTPAIEYKLSNLKKKINKKDIEKEYQCEVTNLSYENSYKKITFDFEFPNKIKEQSYIFNPIIITPHPSSLFGTAVSEKDGLIISFELNHIQPQTKYILCFKTKCTRDQDEPNVYITTDDTINLMPASFYTWMCKNQLPINAFLTFFWLTLILIYILKLLAWGKF